MKEVKKEIENIIKRKWSIKYFCILLDQKLFRFCRISKSKVFIFVSKDFKRYYRTKEIEFEKALKVVCSTK